MNTYSVNKLNVFRFFLFFLIYFIISNQSIFPLIYLFILVFFICLYAKNSKKIRNHGLQLSIIFVILIIPQALPNILENDIVPYGYGYIMISLIASTLTMVLNNDDYKDQKLIDLFFSISSAIFSPATYISGPSATISEINDLSLPKEKTIKLYSFKNTDYKLFISGLFRLSLGLYFADFDFDFVNNLFNSFYLNFFQNSIYFLVIGFINFWKYYLLFSGSSELCKSLLSFFNINVIDNFCNPESAVYYHEIWNKWHLNITQRIREYIFTPITLFALRNFSNSNNKLRYFFVEVMPVIILFLILAVWHGSRPRDYVFAFISIILTLCSRQFSKSKFLNSIIINMKLIKYLFNFLSLSIFGITLLIYDVKIGEPYADNINILNYISPYFLISIIFLIYFKFSKKLFSNKLNLLIQMILACIIQVFFIENNQISENFIYFNN